LVCHFTTTKLDIATSRVPKSIETQLEPIASRSSKFLKSSCAARAKGWVPPEYARSLEEKIIDS